jgi:hypothetical protein
LVVQQTAGAAGGFALQLSAVKKQKQSIPGRFLLSLLVRRSRRARRRRKCVCVCAFMARIGAQADAPSQPSPVI